MTLEELVKAAKEALAEQKHCTRHVFVPIPSQVHEGIASWECICCGMRISDQYHREHHLC